MTGPAMVARVATDPPIPFRTQWNVPDAFDGERVARSRNRWTTQDPLLLARDRDIEDNLRMLAGRQWEVWSNVLQRTVHAHEHLSPAEQQARHRPVINRLLLWFMLHQARMSEGTPIIGWQPASGDERDALLAETMDVLYKIIWREANMEAVVDRAVSWMLAAGEVGLKSRLDFSQGPVRAQPQLAQDGSVAMVEAPRGGLAVDVLSPFEYRGEWGPTPWHDKRWHMHRTFLTPDDVFRQYGVRVMGEDPTTLLQSVVGGSFLARALFGAGHFGAASGTAGIGTPMPSAQRADSGLVVVDELWERPRNPEDPEDMGRLTITVPFQDLVLYDGPRPFNYRQASPIRTVAMLEIPGRPGGSTVIEMLKPLQRAINKGWAQFLDHRALSTTPMMVVDAMSGLKDEQLVSRPGKVLKVVMRPGVSSPVQFITPPPLSSDAWRTQAMLVETFDTLGNLYGAMGRAPTSNASGELVKELRFNDDRFVGPSLRRLVTALAGMCGEDWTLMLPAVFTDEEVLHYTGEDNVVRTLTVLPMLWEASVHAVPDVESMLPDSRAERQARAEKLFAIGAFGNPAEPAAQARYLEMARYPHLNRIQRPGGVDRRTAERQLGELLRGMDPQAQPLYEWYDLSVHLDVLETYMKSADFLDQSDDVKMRLMWRRAQVRTIHQQQQMQAFMAQLQQQTMIARVTASPADGSDDDAATGGRGSSDAD